jgi:predicted amidohydrolase
MDGANLSRRNVIMSSAMAGGAMLTGAMASAAAAAPSETVVPAGPPISYTAAVMRTPVLVPPSLDALPDIRRRNTEAMVAAIEGTMKGAVKPRLLVFPVLQLVSSRRATSGVPMSGVAVDLSAEPLDKGVFAPIVEACRRHNCYVATSTQEKTVRIPGRYFHTGFVMGPEGLVLRSPKSQAKSAPEVSYLRDLPEEYIKAFGPDSILPVVKTPIGNLGCYIEAEAEVFETSRLLAAKGAQVIIHPSLEEDDGTPYVAIKQNIGFQNQVYVLSGTASRWIMKTEPHDDWAGGSSTIVGPDGRLLASIAGHNEGAATATIDLASIETARKKNAAKTTPAWGLYKNLYK